MDMLRDAMRVDPVEVHDALARDGVVMLGPLLGKLQVQRMMDVYEKALRYPTWNTWMGFEQNEKWRRLIENLLLYDRSFVDLALHPDVCEVIRRYVGPAFELVEARGWETITTRRDFHGWHADAWYDERLRPRPREVKLGCYLTDVETGHFQYVRGSHGSDQQPRHHSHREVAAIADRIVDMKGPAGTCFLFDTSGVHRQSSPVLKRRWVIMLNYHDPAATVGMEHAAYGRYRPLLLNSAFLGGLHAEQLRILGIGRSADLPGFHPEGRRYARMHDLIQAMLRLRLEVQDAVGFVREAAAAVRRRLPRAG